MIKTEQIVRDVLNRRWQDNISFFKLSETLSVTSCWWRRTSHLTLRQTTQAMTHNFILLIVSYLLSRSFHLHAKGRAICIPNGHGTCSFCVRHYNSSSLKTQMSFSGQRLLSPPKPDRDWTRPNRFNSTNDILARLNNQAISEVITSAVNSAGLPD